VKPYVLATDLEASDIITASVSEASDIMTAGVSEASDTMTASVSEASDIVIAGVSSSRCLRTRHPNTIMVTSFTNGKRNEVHM